jgi:hypothetical protein
MFKDSSLLSLAQQGHLPIPITKDRTVYESQRDVSTQVGLFVVAGKLVSVSHPDALRMHIRVLKYSISDYVPT